MKIIIVLILLLGLPINALAFSVDGGGSWFGDPRAVHSSNVNDRTFIVSADSGTAPAKCGITISQYDHDTDELTSFALTDEVGGCDGHNVGSVLVDENNLLQVFYLKHNGPNLYYRISTNAEDISAWGAETNIDSSLGGVGYAYPNIMQLDSGERWLFFRDENATGEKPPYYSTSADGTTWAARTQLLDDAGYPDDERPYCKYISDGVDIIHVTCTQGNPNTVSANIYHFYYDDGEGGGTWNASDGTDITVPINLTTEATLVYDGSTFKGWMHDIAINGSNNPVILFAKMKSATNHEYYLATYNAGWTDAFVSKGGASLYSSQPNYSGGGTINKSDTSMVYISREYNNLAGDNGGRFEIRKCTLSGTWDCASITTGSVKINMRPIVPRNSHAELPVIWLYGDYTTFQNYDLDIVDTPAVYSRSLELSGVTLSGVTLSD